MAKPLKDILSGVKSSKTVAGSTGTDPGVDYDPKNPAEQDFVAKHKVEVHADRVGNGDDVYKGKTKQAKYPKQDAKVYEETEELDEKSESFEKVMNKAKEKRKNNPKKHKIIAPVIDRSKTIRYSGDKERLGLHKEEAEELDENTKKRTAMGYDKDGNETGGIQVRSNRQALKLLKKHHPDKEERVTVKLFKGDAPKKGDKGGRVSHSKLAKEEVEINEISKKILKSYQKKATTSANRAHEKSEKESDAAMSTDGNKNPAKQAKHHANAAAAEKVLDKRKAGLKRAEKKVGKDSNKYKRSWWGEGTVEECKHEGGCGCSSKKLLLDKKTRKESAPGDTPIKFPSGAVGDEGRV